MATYRHARRTTNTTSGQAAMDVAGPPGARIRVLEWAITLAAATASTYALFRASPIGTRTSPVPVLPDDAADPTLTGLEDILTDTALAHSVQPTLASEAHCRVALPATIGAGRLWSFPRGIVIAVSLSLVLQNLAANGALDSEVVVDI